MAIAFAQVDIHSRAKGHSAVAASAYRSASKFLDERTGITHDFTNRTDVMFKELLLPEGVIAQFSDREFLWNELERSEKRRDSQVCKDIVLALPKELNLASHIELARRFAHTHFVSNGIPADIAIHNSGDGNPHAHILVPLRRLEKEGFSQHKARDLNPAFAYEKIVEKDFIGKQWGEMQEVFFKEKNINLSVDLNHVIPEKHEGKIRGQSGHYTKETNKIVREARIELVLEQTDNLINQLSLNHSVFTRRDIEKLLFKTLNTPQHGHDYLSAVESILTHRDVISLGVNDQGIDAYTTRHQYIAEAALLKNTESLQARNGHVFSNNDLSLIANQYTLNEEQKEALHYIAHGNDLSVLIGRPGTGKSYLLKPLKEYYESNQCRVTGAALSGKIAKTLQNETGIPSFTLASLTYRLSRELMTLTKNDILVIDEAGMVDFATLSYVLHKADKAEAKVVLIGDPDQLKPIHKGELFRAIAARTGFIELSKIRRQRDKGDRAASLALAKGQIKEALTHYEAKGAIHFSENPQQAVNLLVNNWQGKIEAAVDTKENMMFAFTRAAVSSLNNEARVLLQQKGIIAKEDFIWPQVLMTSDGEEHKDIRMSIGERLLLRKNDNYLQVKNGDMGIIEAINSQRMTVRLDDGTQISLPNTYRYIEYGYAATVHRGQGMTADNTHILIDSPYWDRHLSLVGMTRHRDTLSLYADKYQHPDITSLTATLSRTSTQDNVIDWPLDFAIRSGFDPDRMLGRALNKIAGIGHQIKNKWNYLVNYEAYLKTETVHKTMHDRQNLRAIAKDVASYLDDKLVLRNQDMDRKQDDEQKTDLLYEARLAKNKRAFDLVTQYGASLDKLTAMAPVIESIKKDSARYERYLAVKIAAESSHDKKIDDSFLEKIGEINLSKDYPHIKHVASACQITSSSLYQRIEHLQALPENTQFTEETSQFADVQKFALSEVLTGYVNMANEHHNLALARQSLKLSGDETGAREISYNVTTCLKNLKEFAFEAFKNPHVQKEYEVLKHNKTAGLSNSDGITVLHERFTESSFTSEDIRAVLCRIKGHAQELSRAKEQDRSRGGREQ